MSLGSVAGIPDEYRKQVIGCGRSAFCCRAPRRKWAAVQSVFGEVSGKEVDVEILRHDKEALDIDVTRCRFAEFFRALGEPELGALLICETDFDIASIGEGEVSLERAQTIMRGAPSCTFRYKFAPR